MPNKYIWRGKKCYFSSPILKVVQQNFPLKKQSLYLDWFTSLPMSVMLFICNHIIVNIVHKCICICHHLSSFWNFYFLGENLHFMGGILFFLSRIFLSWYVLGEEFIPSDVYPAPQLFISMKALHPFIFLLVKGYVSRKFFLFFKFLCRPSFYCIRHANISENVILKESKRFTITKCIDKFQ